MSGLKCTPIVLTPQDIDRFWSKVDRSGGPDACWPWIAGNDGNGYGRFWANGRNYRAHRIAYFLAHGDLPPADKPLACHTCDNPPCCNPTCLFAGTNADNTADRNAKDRQAKGERHGWYTRPESRPRGDRNGSRLHPDRLARGDQHGSHLHPERMARGERHGSHLHPERWARGERNGRAKLTEADIPVIRAAAAAGVSKSELSRQFNVDRKTLQDAISGKTWAGIIIEPQAGSGAWLAELASNPPWGQS